MERLLKKLKCELAKFRLTDLQTVARSVLGRVVQAAAITMHIDRKRLTKNKNNIVEVCVYLYKRQKPSEEEVQEKIWLLQLCHMAHQCSRTWFGAQLVKSTSDSSPSLDRFEKYLTRAYKKELRDVKVLHIEKDNLIWVMAIEYRRKSNNRLQYLTPVYFVTDVNLDLPYFLHSPKREDKHHLDIFTSAMGYDNYKSMDLSGKDVYGLFKMIGRQLSRPVALRAPMYLYTVDVDGCTLDYTGRASRTAYAEQILAGGSNLSVFTVESIDKYRGRLYSCSPAAKNLTLNTKLTIQCCKKFTVDDIIKETIVRGDMTIPAPSWVVNMPYQASNYASLQSLVPVVQSISAAPAPVSEDSGAISGEIDGVGRPRNSGGSSDESMDQSI